MALHEAVSYVKHFFTAKSVQGHGVHSPFAFDLITRVFPDQKNDVFPALEELRDQLLTENRRIEVNDLGAGSRKHASNQRTIAAIARHSAKSPKIGRLLYRLARYLNPPHILELGTSLGLSTAYLAKTGIPVTTIEGCENTAREAQLHFNRLQLYNIELRVGNFDDLLPHALKNNPQCSFVFIDGNHTYRATKDYYQILKKNLPSPCVIAFDDIYWSEGMSRAWREIVSDTDNQVTFDLFHLGLVFFKPDQAKEHFSIRI